MVYIYEDGRILYYPNVPPEKDQGKYVPFEVTPSIPEIAGKVGVISGCNLTTGEVTFEYFDIPVPVEPIVPEEPLTDIELIMQANTDAELRDLEIQQNQEILAQQMTDIELVLLGGN